MHDEISTPSVVTHIKIGNFTLHAYAYRKLTKTESVLAAKMYMKQMGINKIPATGSVKVFTQFGNNPTDDL